MMLEKFKDLVYDCSDLILGLVIGIAILGVITWKLMGIMLIPLDLDVFSKLNNPEEKIITHNSPNDEIRPANEINNTNSSTDIPSTTDQSQVIEVIPVESNEITIDIPKGATGYSIAKLLESHGLITTPSDFVTRVEELGLGPKLRFGSFTINSQNTMDEIIYIITGTKQ